MKEGEGKVYQRKGDSGAYIRVPAGIVTDSQFPFRHLEKVALKIEGRRLIVTKEA